MKRRRDYTPQSKLGQARRRNAAMHAQGQRATPAKSRHVVATRDVKQPFSPPEQWHEPEDGSRGYRFVVDEPGAGYRHVVTTAEVSQRLAQLPRHFLDQLEVVHLSRMTRKKQSFPCYGMQWGGALYLYPIENSLREYFSTPPKPDFRNEVQMFGGLWTDHGGGEWTLSWTEATIRDFYLNNILIHELGHLLDNRNTSYTDRERYAEWFAIEYGYRQSGGGTLRRPRFRVRRRHHSV